MREQLLDIFKNCDFTGYINEDTIGTNILSKLPINFSYHYEYGATKLCIMPDNSNFVIKIPFNSAWYDPTQEYIDYESAGYNEHEADYCFTEVVYYKHAKQMKIHKMFCKTQLLGLINNYPIYIQQKATPMCQRDDKRNEDGYYEDARSPYSIDYCELHDFECFNSVWVADAIEYYGKAKFNRLIEFIKEHSIEDLHSGNIGYINERPVLFDFSDYKEGF